MCFESVSRYKVSAKLFTKTTLESYNPKTWLFMFVTVLITIETIIVTNIILCLYFLLYNLSDGTIRWISDKITFAYNNAIALSTSTRHPETEMKSHVPVISPSPLLFNLRPEHSKVSIIAWRLI